MNILIIVGSSKRHSHSLGLGSTINDQLKAHGVASELIDLVEYQLPMFDVAVDKEKSYDEKTAHFVELTKAADAYVWVTPVYHNLPSAILLNALDWQHFSIKGKVVGMASNGNNRGSVAVDRLLFAARAQHLITIPTRVCTDEEDYDDAMNITAQEIQDRIKEFCRELVEITNKIRG